MGILEAEFRPNPDYEIVPLPNLTDAECAAFEGLRDDPECFGILRPRDGSGLRIKSICRQTAALLDSLAVAPGLPEQVRQLPPSEAERHVLDLVLGDAIQVRLDGVYRSGVAAFGLIVQPQAFKGELGRLAQLSLDAVRFGDALPIDDPLRLSAQIYFFNRLPQTPRWARLLPNDEAHARYLGIDAGGRCSKLLRALGGKMADAPELQGWLLWSARESGETSQRRSFSYKLYVSPRPEELPEALPKIVAAFVDFGVLRMKIGAGLGGLLRPDKIVAYFEEFGQLEAVAQRLLADLKGVAPHGVPFTAELGGAGLVSWGMDPHETRSFSWQETSSWRLWITNRLAAAILDARASPESGLTAWRYALERLSVEGVDVQTWAPTAEYERRIAAARRTQGS